MDKCYLCGEQSTSLFPVGKTWTNKGTLLCKKCLKKQGINIALGMIINAKCSICGITTMNVDYFESVYPVCSECVEKSGINKKDKSIRVEQIKDLVLQKSKESMTQDRTGENIKNLIRKNNPIAFVQKAELQVLSEKLQVDENILVAIQGKIERQFGIILLTEKRIIFASGTKFCMETKNIYLTDITDVSQKGISGMGTKLEVRGKSIDFIIDSDKSSVDEFHKVLLNQIHILKNNSTESKYPLSSADEIVKFKKLLDEGVITEEEFNAKKKQLLGL